MSHETLRYEVVDAVATITFDNPPVNLISTRMMVELDELFDRLMVDADVRVLVLDSADPEFFIAHGDMTTAEDPTAFTTMQTIALDQDPALNPMMRLYEKLRNLPQLTVVKLRGLARGGGAELISAADIRFGSELAGLSQMEAPGGNHPGRWRHRVSAEDHRARSLSRGHPGRRSHRRRDSGAVGLAEPGAA